MNIGVTFEGRNYFKNKRTPNINFKYKIILIFLKFVSKVGLDVLSTLVHNPLHRKVSSTGFI